MKFGKHFGLFVSVFFMSMIGPCLAEEIKTTVTLDGLELVKDSNLVLVYAAPDADLGAYEAIYLAEPQIAFKKNWRGNQDANRANAVKADDIAGIRADLSLLFSEIFSRTLVDGGYTLLTGRADDVLLIKPSIANLEIIETGVVSADNAVTFTESAGEMTLYLELYDSVTDDLIARILDRQLDRRTGYIEWQDRINNRAAARRIMQVWANVLLAGLNETLGDNRNYPMPALPTENTELN